MGSYQVGVTEHPDGEGGGTGDGTASATEGEGGRGIPTGDEVDAGHTQPLWCGVIHLYDRGGKSKSGGSSCSLESGKGMAGGEHGQLWPQRGEFTTNVEVGTMVCRGGIRTPQTTCQVGVV